MLSDYDFDQLEQKFQKEFPNSDLINNSTECPREFFVKFERRYLHHKKLREDIKNGERDN
jgi:hypothetical protein